MLKYKRFNQTADPQLGIYEKECRPGQYLNLSNSVFKCVFGIAEELFDGNNITKCNIGSFIKNDTAYQYCGSASSYYLNNGQFE